MIKVLIVDDSALARSFLKEVLAAEPSIDVIGTAPDPYIARDKIIRFNPDVITLDVEMPRMDGITFLKKIMEYYPIPVVIVSSLTKNGALTTLQAFEEGAVEVIAKPRTDITKGFGAISKDIIDKIKIAACAKVQKRVAGKSTPAPKNIADFSLKQSTNKILAIGASTGGTEAIKKILERLPALTPGILIVQHMPAKFTRAFAERLDGICAVNVREAKNMDSVIPGTALIAPGNHHMILKRDGARYYVKTNQEPRVFHQRPSVDVMFKSVAKYAGRNAIGVILTGMGSDGATGLLEMKEAGAKTLAQDKRSSIVFGMPNEAIKIGAVDKVLTLSKIPQEILFITEAAGA